MQDIPKTPNMPIKPNNSLVGDLAGLSQPITKLIEVVSSGIGRTASALWFSKREADNEAYKMRKLGEAKTQVAIEQMKAVTELSEVAKKPIQKLTLSNGEVGAELSEAEKETLSLKERSTKREEYQNLLHQINTEKTIDFAAEELNQQNNDTVSEESVDESWTARYFNIVQDISSEELQALWGRVLAGEIQKPKSYSLRTLDVLKNLSRYEAELFTKSCQYLFVTRHDDYRRNYSFYREELWIHGIDKNLSFAEISVLMDCGLIQYERETNLVIPIEGGVNVVMQAGKAAIFISGIPKHNNKINTKVYSLTIAGSEISNLVKVDFSHEHLKEIAGFFKNNGLKVEYAEFAGWAAENATMYKGEREEFAF